jgi:protein-tyrosine phosphatase
MKRRGFLSTVLVAGLAALLVSAVPSLPGCADGPPPPRRVVLDGQDNFRDLGGYGTADGRTVRWGEVFRAGSLSRLTGADLARLEELGLRTVVDFMQPEETLGGGRDRLPAGVRSIALPLGADRGAELVLQARTAIMTGRFDEIPSDLHAEYHRALLDGGREQFAAFLRAVADPANRPLVFHGTHGIHRTGTAAAILLSALGVPWETVREDYLLTNVYRREEVAAALEGIRTGVAQIQGVDPASLDMSPVEAFYVLSAGSIDAVREQAAAGYGSLDDYIREGLGVTDAEIARLRQELLE